MTTINTDQNKRSRAPNEQHGSSQINQILTTVFENEFEQWHQEQQFRQNIRNGQSYFNGPEAIPNPRQFRPSDLLQCHRKTYYRHFNAPEETPDPHGRFWFGERFEEDLIVPYLVDIIENSGDGYIQNSLWIDITESTDVGELQIKGVTDPVIVDENAHPLVPTEIKTTGSIEYRDQPSQHHRAQLTAYLRGLSRNYDRDITDGILIYGDRNTFETRSFPVHFDESFWARVREWMITETRARLTETLPPADPEQSWECEYCAYRHRCGQTDKPHGDVGPIGFLPLHSYPKSKVLEYLQAHADAGAKLTPTLAHLYPDLPTDYGVHDWECEACGSSYEWDTVDWEGNPSESPPCPSCAQSGRYGTLRGLPSESQHHSLTSPTTEQAND